MRTLGQHGFVERRKLRTEDLEGALALLLEQCRTRAALDALALSDESGVLVAGAGAHGMCEELAARAPLATSGREKAQLAAPGPFATGSVVVRSLRVSGQKVLLSGLRASGAREDELSEAGLGCARILA